LANGGELHNKLLILENKAFLTYLNTILTEQQIAFQSDNLRDIRALQTIVSAIELVFTIITGNQN
jgi:hypothetical protein